MMKVEAHEVWPKIWVGSAPHETNPLANFDLLVLCAREYQPTMWAFRGAVHNVGFDDDNRTFSEAAFQAVVSAGQYVAQEAANGKACLVTCHAGLNRSALVAAIAMLHSDPTLTGDAVIETIRVRRRGPALIGAIPLSNDRFVDVIRKYRR